MTGERLGTILGARGYVGVVELVRILAEHFGLEFVDLEERPIDPSAVVPDWVLEGGSHTFFRSVGCNACSNTGYKGRLAIHEVLAMTEEIDHLVVSKAIPATSRRWRSSWG